jgi:lipopolysaccharide/colanic/teichoic acid biosynthesis glycosyltransferase
VEEIIVKKAGYKRWFDLGTLILAHILLFPIWLIIWLFVPFLIWREDRGPVFYKQERIGKLLRSTALDELPQIFNILKGDMNFVGPRAFNLAEHRLIEKQIPDFKRRLLVKPGLTSLAEVCEDSDDPYLTLRYDLEYISRMNIALDIKIMILSILNTLRMRWGGRRGKALIKI